MSFLSSLIFSSSSLVFFSSLLFHLLVFFFFLLSSSSLFLVLSCLSFSVLLSVLSLFSVFFSLSSLSVFCLSLSSVSSLSSRVVLCVVVLCVGVVCVVRCVARPWHAEKKPPCVDAKTSPVCNRHHAHMCLTTCGAWCRYTRGDVFASTHGGFFWTDTRRAGGSSSVAAYQKFWATCGSSRAFRGFTTRKPMDLTHFSVLRNRSRANTFARFLQNIPLCLMKAV